MISSRNPFVSWMGSPIQQHRLGRWKSFNPSTTAPKQESISRWIMRSHPQSATTNDDDSSIREDLLLWLILPPHTQHNDMMMAHTTLATFCGARCRAFIHPRTLYTPTHFDRRCHKFQRRLAARRCKRRVWVRSIRFYTKLGGLRWGYGNVRKSEVLKFTSWVKLRLWWIMYIAATAATTVG